MAKRDILRAAARKGLVLDEVSFDWIPEPGESVPTWSVLVSDESQEKFHCEGFKYFANTAEVLAWIAELQPASAQGERDE